MQLGRRMGSELVPSCPAEKEALTVFLILDSAIELKNAE
jgi:hypothetical protein